MQKVKVLEGNQMYQADLKSYEETDKKNNEPIKYSFLLTFALGLGSLLARSATYNKQSKLSNMTYNYNRAQKTLDRIGDDRANIAQIIALKKEEQRG